MSSTRLYDTDTSDYFNFYEAHSYDDIPPQYRPFESEEEKKARDEMIKKRDLEEKREKQEKKEREEKEDKEIQEKRKKIIVYGLSGLDNMGNTCYMNSTLQCLGKIRCLNDYLIDDELYKHYFDQYLTENIKDVLAAKARKDKGLDADASVTIYVKDFNNKHDYSITDALHNLLSQMWLENCEITPRTMKEAISRAPKSIFGGYSQQDSQEVLSLILDRIHEECKTDDVSIDFKKVPPSVLEMFKIRNRYAIQLKNQDITPEDKKILTNELRKYMNDNYEDSVQLKAISHWQKYIEKNGCSLLTELFCGQFCSSIQCEKCNFNSPSFDIFMGVLSIPIPESGESTLEECLETFSKEEHLTGENQYKCDNCNEKTDAIKKMWLFELPPVVIIQLKRFKHLGNSLMKNSSKVKFPIKGLTFTKNMFPFHVDDAKYDLCAITQHTGSINGGHYVAYGLNHINKKWYIYNDNKIAHVPESDLEGELITNNSYVLYYEKRAEPASVTFVKSDNTDDFQDATS